MTQNVLCHGEKGEKGDPGGVDASNYYTKAESDGRFLSKGTVKSGRVRLDPGASASLSFGPEMPTVSCFCVRTASVNQSEAHLRITDGKVWQIVAQRNNDTPATTASTTGYGMGIAGNVAKAMFQATRKNEAGPVFTFNVTSVLLPTVEGSDCLLMYTTTVDGE